MVYIVDGVEYLYYIVYSEYDEVVNNIMRYNMYNIIYK